MNTLGAICAQLGQFEEALTLTEKAYALTPWRHPVIGQLAALLLRGGATNRADALLKELGTGEAAVTILSERGVPTPFVHTRLRAPRSSMTTAAGIADSAKGSPPAATRRRPPSNPA